MANFFATTTTTLLVLSLAGSALSQGNPPQQASGGPLGNLLGNNGPLGSLLGNNGALGSLLGSNGPVGSLLGSNGALGTGQGQNGVPLGGLTNGVNNLLSSLSGGLGGQQQQPAGGQSPQQQGLSDLLRRLPQRSIEVLQTILNSVKNLLPGGGMGRNGQQQTPMRNPMDAMNGQMPLNMPNPFAMPNMNGANADPLGLNGFTRPVTDLLSNGQLPDVNQLTNQLTRTLSGGNSNQPMGMSFPSAPGIPSQGAATAATTATNANVQV